MSEPVLVLCASFDAARGEQLEFQPRRRWSERIVQPPLISDAFIDAGGEKLYFRPMTFPLAFVVGVSVASIPGPTIILIATQTLRHGPRAALVTMLAPLALDAFLMLPLGLVFQTSLFGGKGSLILALCGSAFLFWLGVQSVLAGARVSRAPDPMLSEPNTRHLTPDTRSQEMAPFVKGLLTHIASPYPYLYWATVGASFIRQGFASGGVLGAALFPLGFWLGACSFTVVVIYLVARTKRLLPPSVEPYLHHVSGALLIGGGIYLAVSSWKGPF